MENTRKKRIAFIKSGSFSHINQSVARELVKVFPEFEVEVIDVNRDILNSNGASKLSVMLGASLAGISEYGSRAIGKPGNLLKVAKKTGYFTETVSRMISSHIQKKGIENYAFTFQMQSLFNAAVPGLPNFIYTDHTHHASRYYPGFKEGELNSDHWQNTEYRMYQQATRVFTMSSHVSNSLKEFYHCSEDKVSCVFAGTNAKVDKGPFNASRYARKNILFVGVDWERKGGPQLAKAFEKVLETHPDATLTVIGCSPDINIPNCEIKGRIPLEEVKEYYKQATLFCMPTRKEPFGVVFLEAMHYQLPVVTSNIGATNDLVTNGQNGYKLDVDDVEGMARRLSELVGDPRKCAEFGACGYRLVKENYSWEAAVQKIRDHIASDLGIGQVVVHV